MDSDAEAGQTGEVSLLDRHAAEDVEDVKEDPEDALELPEPDAVFDEDEIDLQGLEDFRHMRSRSQWDRPTVGRTDRPTAFFLRISSKSEHEPVLRRYPEAGASREPPAVNGAEHP